MKRTAAAFALIAGLGGCASPQMGQPGASMDVSNVRGQQAEYAAQNSSVHQAAYVRSGRLSDPNQQYVGGVVQTAGIGENRYPPEVYGPRYSGMDLVRGGGGIMPAPTMGPQGVVAGVGFGGPGMGAGGQMFANQRTSVRFMAPPGMKIAFQDGSGGFADPAREAPVRYNFPQGAIYRLRLNGIPNRPGKNYYPTLELYPTTQKTVEFLSHSTVPVGFTDEDFEQVNAGNMVVKVVYLPDAQFQDLAVAQEIVSTTLEPGVDPKEEAMRRGTILAVIRLGNIDLEDPSTPAMEAPFGGMGGPSQAPNPLPGPTSSGARLPESMPSARLPELPTR